MTWIDPYYRIRFGRIEYVRGHWRGLSRPKDSVLSKAS